LVVACSFNRRSWLYIPIANHHYLLPSLTINRTLLFPRAE
jgi:hypothetical protein